ncbi:hypothetical protein BH10PSE3_BH10PSE3_30880 [soil metagenome]
MARACAARGLPLVHLSTDCVFDGDLDWPYREDDVARPLSVYGRTKLDGETAVLVWEKGVGAENFLGVLALWPQLHPHHAEARADAGP